MTNEPTDVLVVGAGPTGLFLALLPLVAILGFTIVKGMHRFDADFLTHSMRNVAENDYKNLLNGCIKRH